MSIHASGSFAFTSWDERPCRTIEGGPKLTRAGAVSTFQGDIEAEGLLESVMVHLGTRSGDFSGLEHVIGRIGGRSGSFVLRHRGSFRGATVEGSWSVVPGSGTGELRGLHGEGGYRAWPGQPRTSFTLDYDFA